MYFTHFRSSSILSGRFTEVLFDSSELFSAVAAAQEDHCECASHDEHQSIRSDGHDDATGGGSVLSVNKRCGRGDIILTNAARITGLRGSVFIYGSFCDSVAYTIRNIGKLDRFAMLQLDSNSLNSGPSIILSLIILPVPGMVAVVLVLSWATFS